MLKFRSPFSSFLSQSHYEYLQSLSEASLSRFLYGFDSSVFNRIMGQIVSSVVSDILTDLLCLTQYDSLSWTDRVGNEVVLRGGKGERNIVHTVKRKKANWIGHILCRNCFLRQVTEGKIEGRIELTGRLGTRRKQLLDDLKDNRE